MQSWVAPSARLFYLYLVTCWHRKYTQADVQAYKAIDLQHDMSLTQGLIFMYVDEEICWQGTIA